MPLAVAYTAEAQALALKYTVDRAGNAAAESVAFHTATTN
jgi:hypothetical protein